MSADIFFWIFILLVILVACAAALTGSKPKTFKRKRGSLKYGAVFGKQDFNAADYETKDREYSDRVYKVYEHSGRDRHHKN